MTHRNYFITLSALFVALFIFLGISPHDRADWALENVLVVALAVWLGVSYKSSPLSSTSYTCLFIFLCLHEVGSHYTYSNVPYDDFFKAYFNFSLNETMGWERNHFDRLVHFLYGVLWAYPIREIYCRAANLRGFWSYFFPVEFVMASSMIYELIEWGAAEFFGGDLGVAYLGTQGDVWDAHKDMLLASIGACITMLITYYLVKRVSSVAQRGVVPE